jgi:hypothetical protein
MKERDGSFCPPLKWLLHLLGTGSMPGAFVPQHPWSAAVVARQQLKVLPPRCRNPAVGKGAQPDPGEAP